MFIEWKDELSVGVAEIDDDHKKLISIVNKFHDAYVSGTARSTIIETLSEIAEYTTWHFDHEENIMRRLDFPELKTHAAQHTELLNQMGQILADYEVGKTELSDDILNFLRDWIVIHLQTQDRELGLWIQSNGAG